METVAFGMAKASIHGGEVEVHFAHELGLERLRFQIEDDEAPQAQMVKEEVKVEVLALDFHVVLAADEGEPYAEFEDQRAQIFDQPSLKVALPHFRTERHEVEAVRVLEDLLSEFRLLGGQCPRKVRQSAALACEQPAFDLVDEDVTAPAVFDSLARIPRSLRRRFHCVKKADIMAPGQ